MADNCAICLEPLVNNLVTLCRGVDEHHVAWNHKFHRHCIIEWINAPINIQGIQCPLCRRVIRQEDIEELPDDMWRPMNIVYNGITVVITAAMVRQFVLAYNYADEYNKNIEIERIASRHHYDSSKMLKNVEAPGSMATIDQLTNARYRAHQNNVAFLAAREPFSNRLRNLSNAGFMNESIKGMGLLFILIQFLRFKLRMNKKDRIRVRGGGKQLCINDDECIDVPDEFRTIISERLQALKKSPILLENGQLGGRVKTPSYRKTRKNRK